MTSIGILSDTHLVSCDNDFLHRITHAFNGCDIIIHAGDLTDVAILKAFSGKNVYAVHGNMCNLTTQKALPEYRTLIQDGYTIGICHGAGNRHNIEDRMFTLFPQADCIVYGHTHLAVCHTVGTTLFINPGSFQSTGRYGAQGTYGILQINDDGLHGAIHELPWTS
ncbi:metallophosphoesterase family protein [Desulfopila aestuarii]|uniref:Phosphoesterase n=1 Tax=Desulfopila aestuarii DSM 18488 TaxID=1121416 RepID=A0A1M7Y2H6_9BACT|nr:YfcE family phosphodiesterase [Desulfopila aestuarii]SHO46146.1 hypothetical protein SAMN02745220_01319 [Desulfopila aestuarii DSM 18488]